MSVEKIIEKLEMVKEFEIKESYLDDYIKEQEKYIESLKKIKEQKLSPVDTIKLIEKERKSIKQLNDCCFDYKIIFDMLKSSGKNITLLEVKKYLSYKLK